MLCFPQTKTYHMVDEEEEMLQSAEGTDIQWEAGKNPTVKARPAASAVPRRLPGIPSSLLADWQKLAVVSVLGWLSSCVKAPTSWCHALPQEEE